MEYHGKLYGRFNGKYFDTGITSEDYDKLVNRNTEMLDMLQAHIFALDNGQLAFYEKYGFNVSELSDRVRQLINSTTTI